MLQSNAEFIPQLSMHTQHLRELTNKHQKFQWDRKHQTEFDDIKALFCRDTLIRFFNPDLPTFIFVDAHRSGLAAILAQGYSISMALPISMASRATTKIERRYPQLDLEGMSIEFGLRRYRQYLVGGPEVTVVTDHKPLVTIFNNKRLGSIRLDRVKLRHQDVPFQVVWRQGKSNPADYLSRHATPLKDLPKLVV